MARTATGNLVIEAARKQLVEAKTIEALRSAQAVIFPLDFNLSLQDTASALGLSKGWICRMRRNFIKEWMQPKRASVTRAKPGSGRGRAYLSRDEEQELLRPFVEKASDAGLLVVDEIRRALEKRLGHPTAKATVYNLLHRHGWRKLAPDKRHVKANVEAQEDWKKNFLKSCEESRKTGEEKERARSV